MPKKHIQLTRRRMSHVIDELYTSLFRAGCHEVNIRLTREENGLRLFVEGDYTPEHRAELERMAKLLRPEVRDMGLVEEYWELAGDDQCTPDSELVLVGQIVDDAKITIDERSVALELYLSFYKSTSGTK